MVSMVGRANVAYRAKGPVGHGRTLLLHVAHADKLQKQPERLSDCMVGVHKCVRNERENML